MQLAFEDFDFAAPTNWATILQNLHNTRRSALLQKRVPRALDPSSIASFLFCASSRDVASDRLSARGKQSRHSGGRHKTTKMEVVISSKMLVSALVARIAGVPTSEGSDGCVKLGRFVAGATTDGYCALANVFLTLLATNQSSPYAARPSLTTSPALALWRRRQLLESWAAIRRSPRKCVATLRASFSPSPLQLCTFAHDTILTYSSCSWNSGWVW